MLICDRVKQRVPFSCVVSFGLFVVVTTVEDMLLTQTFDVRKIENMEFGENLFHKSLISTEASFQERLPIVIIRVTFLFRCWFRFFTITYALQLLSRCESNKLSWSCTSLNYLLIYYFWCLRLLFWLFWSLIIFFVWRFSILSILICF